MTADLATRLAELEQQNAYLTRSNRALAQLLADATQRIEELTPEPLGRPRLAVLRGGQA